MRGTGQGRNAWSVPAAVADADQRAVSASPGAQPIQGTMTNGTVVGSGSIGGTRGAIDAFDLNDQLGTATGIAGGRQTIFTGGLNWYVNQNIRFMFNYQHGNIDKQVSATSPADAGAKFDALAMRTQIAF
jgi:hypothetical protein